MALPTKRLGKDGPTITRVGFGAWAIGGGGWAFGWGPQDDDDALRAMRHAVERGVNWIDTAAVYGLGHSEELVGRLLRELPASRRPLVFTKCGLVWSETDRMANPKRVLARGSIRKECEASLKRLGVDTIDLYQFHWPDSTGVPHEESWGELLKLVTEGKVRWAGVSNYDATMLEACEALGHVTSLQPPFSPIRREAAARELPWCGAHGTGVIVYSPMMSGLLTEKWTQDRVASLPADDWRRKSPAFVPPQLEKNLALRDALIPIAKRHGTNPGSIAIAWTLAFPEVSAAIVGARTPEQVDGWIDAGAIALSPQDLDEIAAAIARTGSGSGPAHPQRRS